MFRAIKLPDGDVVLMADSEFADLVSLTADENIAYLDAHKNRITNEQWERVLGRLEELPEGFLPDAQIKEIIAAERAAELQGISYEEDYIDWRTK